MKIWLTQEKETLRLPVIPSSIELSNTRNNATVNINSIGEINLIGKSGLRTLSLSSFFPKQKYDFVIYSDFPSPKKCVDLILSWMEKPVTIRIAHSSALNRVKDTSNQRTEEEIEKEEEEIEYMLAKDISDFKVPNLKMLATIESFSYSHQDATGDVYYTIELKEYKKPKLSTNKNSTVSKTGTNVEKASTKRTTKSVKSTTYIVKSGDTLMGIAKKITGSANNYKAIANQNKIQNPNKIYVGQKLVIKI